MLNIPYKQSDSALSGLLYFSLILYTNVYLNKIRFFDTLTNVNR